MSDPSESIGQKGVTLEATDKLSPIWLKNQNCRQNCHKSSHRPVGPPVPPYVVSTSWGIRVGKGGPYAYIGGWNKRGENTQRIVNDLLKAAKSSLGHS